MGILLQFHYNTYKTKNQGVLRKKTIYPAIFRQTVTFSTHPSRNAVFRAQVQKNGRVTRSHPPIRLQGIPISDAARGGPEPCQPRSVSVDSQAVDRLLFPRMEETEDQCACFIAHRAVVVNCFWHFLVLFTVETFPVFSPKPRPILPKSGERWRIPSSHSPFWREESRTREHFPALRCQRALRA